MRRTGRLEAEGQAAEQGLCMARSNELVLGGATLLLGRLGRKQVPEAGGPANQLATGGQFEALGNGLLGLLHERSGQTHRVAEGLARGKSPRPAPQRNLNAYSRFCRCSGPKCSPAKWVAGCLVFESKKKSV